MTDDRAGMAERLDALEKRNRELVEHMEEMRRSFRMVHDRSPLPTLLIDYASGCLLDANSAALRFYGLTPDTLSETRIWGLNTRGEEGTRALMREVLEAGSMVFPLEHRRHDGALRQVEVHSSAVMDGDRQRLLSVVVDMTDQWAAEMELEAVGEQMNAMNQQLIAANRELQAEVERRGRTERELLRAKERAEVASRTKNEFLANMSHEVRTPLNGVMGMLQLLETTGLDPEQEELVSTALSSSRGLMTILNDILDLSIIESGHMNLVSEPFDLAYVVEDVLKVFRQQAREKGLNLELWVHPDAPRRVMGARGRFRQVLFNLLGNAIKFTARGEICVEVAPLPAPAGLSRVLVAVSDTGVGIPEDKLEGVFESFTQVDGSYTRGYQGTGLGLGIVRRLVELMGGEVNIGSRLGKGTAVHLCLPLQPHDGGIAQEDRPLILRRFPRGTRVLVAEDSRPNMIMVRRFLEKLGLEVEEAANGREALDKLATDGPFSCVLMDVQMPELDGMEATRRIRAGAGGASGDDVPIVALTAHAMKGDRELFLKAGMDDYLPKPVEILDLANLLSSLLAGKLEQ